MAQEKDTIQIVVLECPECKARLVVEKEQEDCFCHKCGHHIDEMDDCVVKYADVRADSKLNKMVKEKRAAIKMQRYEESKNKRLLITYGLAVALALLFVLLAPYNTDAAVGGICFAFLFFSLTIFLVWTYDRI